VQLPSRDAVRHGLSDGLAPPAAAWPATRAAGLARLAAFLPKAGHAYAAGRNHDHGPDSRGNVSVLSPWIRFRLVTEPEVVAAVLGRHAPSACAKFVQEVCWRTYWKGWLELHPGAWTRYRTGVDARLAEVDRSASLADRYRRAIEGRTGLACFDVWAAELVATGYLHNHARMWMASLWIFTLRLPWELGADWFLRHLVDGDPASNTLSWRWVGGLQTRGKHYLARASNIAEYTGGRFDPRGEIDEAAAPLPGDAPFDRVALRAPARPCTGMRTGLLVTPDDLHPESAFPSSPPIDWVAAAALDGVDPGSPLPSGAVAAAFRCAALDDAAARWSSVAGMAVERLDAARGASAVIEATIDWARGQRLGQVVAPHACTGPLRELFDALGPALSAHGIDLVQWQRRWDATAWPQASRGFFHFREKVGALTADCRAMNHSA
jgi:deoxyribodipyrimidine photo-lyase